MSAIQDNTVRKDPPTQAAAASDNAPDAAEPGAAEPSAAKGPAPSPDRLLRAAFARASQVFGQTVSIFIQSPRHRHLMLSDLEWRVIPPIALRQYRLVQHKGAPAGFLSWALVSEDVEQRLQQPDFRLRPQDWKSGDRVWIVDVVAPPQQAEVLIDKVKAELFEGREVRVRKGAVPGEVGDRSNTDSLDDA